MDQQDLTEELTRLLAREQMRGRKGVTLPAETTGSFFAKRTRSVSAAPHARKEIPPAPPSSPPSFTPPVPPAPRAMPIPMVAAAGDRLEQLDLASLEQQVSGCRKCELGQTRTQSVFSRGGAEAKVMFVGEGPGAEEDRQGLPFVGEAGQLLDRMIAAMQLSIQEVYIANIVKCRPPRNRNPEEAEAAACLPYLERQIELVRPQVIVLLGAVPLRFLLKGAGITKARGKWLDYHGTPVMPTYHPAYLLRVPQKKREVWGDLQQVMRLLGKAPTE